MGADGANAAEEIGCFCVHVAVDDVEVFVVDEGEDLADGCFADAGLADEQEGLVEFVGHALGVVWKKCLVLVVYNLVMNVSLV